MPRGGPRVGAGRKPKARSSGAPSGAVSRPLVAGETDSGLLPLEYMLQVIRDPETDASRRDRMAVAAAPYLHPKVAESGKKEQKKGAADRALTGKFAPAPPPRLVVNNK